MIFRDSVLVRATLAGLVGVAALTAQKYTDPDTLAPAYPTPQSVVDQMLVMARIKPGETVYDLGCGDGRIVVAAAQKYQAKAVGIEIRREIYEKTAAHVSSMGLSDQVTIVHGNALRADLTGADVVTLYLLTSSNERLRPILEKQLKPTARVISHDFEIRGWKPAAVEKMMVDGRQHRVYLYLMNAR
jgi:ubiquinone/menaquinone biosynthesis C-methylase UbiE